MDDAAILDIVKKKGRVFRLRKVLSSLADNGGEGDNENKGQILTILPYFDDEIMKLSKEGGQISTFLFRSQGLRSQLTISTTYNIPPPL